MSEAMERKELLEIKGLTKQFPGVLALDHVDLTIREGEIHVLLGENGAGKSTLIKSIIGVVKPNEGELRWRGKPVHTNSIKEAYNLGIAVIYQELSNIQCLNVIENMFVGNEIQKNGFINWKAQYTQAKEYLEKVGCDIDPYIICEKLGMGQKQMVEIAKALQRKAKLIIMDEPTASLSRKEIDKLLELMLQLKSEGISILFITHKLDEAQKVGDVVTVLKDGKKAGDTLPIQKADEDTIIHMMVGRTLAEKYPPRNAKIQEEVLRVEHLSGEKFKDISFAVRKGEVLGIFGLIGAGRTETMRALFGADDISGGQVLFENKEIIIRNERDAIAHGIVLISENRKEEGLILIHDVIENATLPSMKNFCRKSGLLDNKERADKTSEYGKKMNLRPLHIHKNVADFSGGNQQKIVIEKWVMANAQVYIFDEPTKGVDVGAKVEIYTIMNKLAEQGAAIIMVSSEMQEILGMSDNVMVMYEGRKTGYVAKSSKMTHENLMILGTGGSIDAKEQREK